MNLKRFQEIMKRLPVFSVLILAVLAFLFIQPAAQAQVPTYGYQTLLSSCFITNSATINPTNSVIDIGKQASTLLQITQYASAACNSNVVYYISRSVDGVTFETTPLTVITYVLNGTNQLTYATNIPSWGAGYMKISKIVNASDVTNIYTSLSYGVKISAP